MLKHFEILSGDWVIGVLHSTPSATCVVRYVNSIDQCQLRIGLKDHTTDGEAAFGRMRDNVSHTR